MSFDATEAEEKEKKYLQTKNIFTVSSWLLAESISAYKKK